MKRPRRTVKRFEDLPVAEPGCSPFVLEADGLLSLHFDYLSIQSQMRIANPVELVLGYTRTMMGFLLFTPEPRRIGMIGLGGGSLAKYCHEYLPAADITVVEINPEVIALRREFAIPPDGARFRVLCGDGADFVRNHAGTFDVLIVDGFDLEGQAVQLGSQAFYDDCHARLAEGGTLVVNLWGCDEKRERLRAKNSRGVRRPQAFRRGGRAGQSDRLRHQEYSLSATPARPARPGHTPGAIAPDELSSDRAAHHQPAAGTRGGAGAMSLHRWCFDVSSLPATVRHPHLPIWFRMESSIRIRKGGKRHPPR